MKSPALKERQIDELTHWKWNAFHSLSFTFSREIRISFLGTLSFTVVIFSRYNFFYSDNFCTKNFYLENRMQTGVKHRSKRCRVTFRTRNSMHIFLVKALLLCFVQCDIWSLMSKFFIANKNRKKIVYIQGKQLSFQ